MRLKSKVLILPIEELTNILPFRIVRMRQSREWSQHKLAKKAGISISALNRIERGKASNIELRTLLKLCEIFSVSPDFLLGFDRDDGHVRAVMQSGGTVVYHLIPQQTNGEPIKCIHCDRLLIPKVLHTMPDCIVALFERGKSDEYLSAKFNLSIPVIKHILTDELKRLREERPPLRKAAAAGKKNGG